MKWGKKSAPAPAIPTETVKVVPSAKQSTMRMSENPEILAYLKELLVDNRKINLEEIL